jgi:hypothetical protein
MNVLVEESSLSAIASAIRGKNGGSDTYTPGQMASAIDDLNVGASGNLIQKTVTEEGTYLASDDNADGYSSFTNDIPWYKVPLVFDENLNGYVMNGKWSINGSTVNYSDIYAVEADHTYLIQLGANVGTRFRALYTTQNTAGSRVEITGTMIQNTSNPSTYASVTWTAPGNGYLTITKDNAGKSGIPTYVFDISIIE